ncbi:NUDIX hydrolase [Acholeplasma sp. OttesenSCG-928-E16]|nr:NUDIX hydrolase [Acholeplasma sp. OttesenSCG-928-E16]
MQKYNVIMVINKAFDKLLMCKRKNEPYKGLLNLVGGKVEANENNIDGAYRELLEETGISNNDISLIHIMNFDYLIDKVEVQFFAGALNKEVTLEEEINALCWIDITENFFDKNKFAGEGNIGHMLEHALINRKYLEK